MNAELVFGVVALTVAVAYYALARAIPTSMLDDVVGSQGVPFVYAVALATLASLQIARAVMARRNAPRPADLPAWSDRRTLGTLALGIGYASLLPWLGYAGSIGLLLAATAAYQGAGFNRRVVLIAVGGAAFMWVLFVWLLGIPQPAGMWSSL